MNYWLLKSEPDVWSISQQKKAGLKGAAWDGVRNYQARNNLKKMKVEIKGSLEEESGRRRRDLHKWI
mgnify:CR=1 FL=1